MLKPFAAGSAVDKLGKPASRDDVVDATTSTPSRVASASKKRKTPSQSELAAQFEAAASAPPVVLDQNLSADEISEKKKRFKSLLSQNLCEDGDNVATIANLEGKLQMSQPLKKHLVAEWNMILNEPRKLVVLPKSEKFTVEAVLADFLEQKKRSVDAQQVRFITLYSLSLSHVHQNTFDIELW